VPQILLDLDGTGSSLSLSFARKAALLGEQHELRMKFYVREHAFDDRVAEPARQSTDKAAGLAMGGACRFDVRTQLLVRCRVVAQPLMHRMLARREEKVEERRKADQHGEGGDERHILQHVVAGMRGGCDRETRYEVPYPQCGAPFNERLGQRREDCRGAKASDDPVADRGVVEGVEVVDVLEYAESGADCETHDQRVDQKADSVAE